MPAEHHAHSSRTSASGAGWECAEPGTFGRLMPERAPAFSWRRPLVLWRSRNDVIARWFGDPTNEHRRRWVAGRLADGADPSFTMTRPERTWSMLLLGDTGEGDRSQYAVVPGALKMGADTDFMVIASDVIYPVGSVNDYPAKFFRPYRDYPAPIFAIPGNHDWYDGLNGFMRIFCGASVPTPAAPAARWRGPFGPLARLLWRRPDVPDEAALEAAAALRGAPAQRAVQPGPYWSIDTPVLRIIAIDTGIVGTLDRDQGEWLRAVSAGPKPKLLISGKPLYVDNVCHPCPIEGGGTVLEIVDDPAHNYVAAIGGDIHNYQRYPVPSPGGRTVQHIVSGGGGAFMHATHTIPRTRIVPEQDFRCYPLRGDSLATYSRLYGRWLHLPRLFRLSPDEAAAAVVHRLGIPFTRTPSGGEELRPGRRARIIAALLGVPCGERRRSRWRRLPVRRLPQRFRSEVADWDTPPFFKSFLRLDVTEDELRIRCYAATGCGEHEVNPPLEDEVTVPLRPGSPPPPGRPVVPPQVGRAARRDRTPPASAASP